MRTFYKYTLQRIDILQHTIFNVKTENKINALVNVPKEETHHESDNLNRIKRIHVLTPFALLLTHDKRNVSLSCQSI